MMQDEFLKSEQRREELEQALEQAFTNMELLNSQFENCADQLTQTESKNEELQAMNTQLKMKV